MESSPPNVVAEVLWCIQQASHEFVNFSDLDMIICRRNFCFKCLLNQTPFDSPILPQRHQPHRKIPAYPAKRFKTERIDWEAYSQFDHCQTRPVGVDRSLLEEFNSNIVVMNNNIVLAKNSKIGHIPCARTSGRRSRVRIHLVTVFLTPLSEAKPWLHVDQITSMTCQPVRCRRTRRECKTRQRRYVTPPEAY